MGKRIKPVRPEREADAPRWDPLSQFLPFRVLQEAIKAVPEVKYALGVAGIASAVAIVAALGINLRVAFYGTIVLFVLMVLLVIFARVRATGAKHFLAPALVLIWACLVLMILVSLLLVLGVFFHWPVDLGDWIRPDRPQATTMPSTASAAEDENLIRAAALQVAAGDEAGAWRLFEPRMASGNTTPALRKARVQVAMAWLRNMYISTSDGEKFSTFVDKLLPALYDALPSAQGQEAGDLHAHIGWANQLKRYDGQLTGDPKKSYAEALRADPQNAYAHAMLGSSILRYGQGDPRQRDEEAKKHFAAALQSGRDRPYVRELQLAGWSSLDDRTELIRAVNDMRINAEQIGKSTEVWRIVSDLYPTPDEEAHRILFAISPQDNLATFHWLTDGEDQQNKVKFAYWNARFIEATGDYQQALKLYIESGGGLADYSYADAIQEAIARCEKNGVAAAPVLAAALADPKPAVRATAVGSVPAIYKNAKQGIPLLLSAVRDEDKDVRAAARASVITYGLAALPSALELLKSPSERDRRNAIAMLKSLSPPASAVPALIDSLNDNDEEVRCGAGEILEGMDSGAAPAVTAMIQRLSSDTSRRMRGIAAITLGNIGPPAAPAVPALMDATRRDDARDLAIEALGKIGPAAKDAVPLLIEVLDARKMKTQEDMIVPWTTAQALGRIGADAKPAIPALIRAMQKSSWDNRSVHAEAVAAIAQELREKEDVHAVPMLKDGLKAIQESETEAGANSANNEAIKKDLESVRAAKDTVRSAVDYLQAKPR